MSSFDRMSIIALAAGCLLTACATDMGSEEDDAELNAVRQEAVSSINGLKTINGLRTLNGMVSVNGLTTTNGLRTMNGMRTMNGLRTMNGMRTMNGLQVDCTGATAGKTCTGEPDGMMDNATGLMSSDEGIATAKYLIRCALPANDSIRIKDYTGGLVSLTGELGLTPEWKDGQCDTTCQEKISACLMAFTNGDGVHVDVELAAPYTLGTGHTYKYQEASFYGNIFLDKPAMFFCVGKDYAESGIVIKVLEERACQGYNEKDGKCPYVKAGYCQNVISLNILSGDSLLNDNKCSYNFGVDTAKTCKDNSSSGLLFSSGKSWNYPITTFRTVKN
jgi:hypothetical protein